jgi:hypothetical protein
MGQKDVAQLLDQTLKEEEATDKTLTQIAKTLYKEAQRTGRSSGSESNGGSSRCSSGRGAAASRGRRSQQEEQVEEDVEV